MATLSAAEKADIAAELRVVASWVQGPRRTKVLALAARIEGEEVETPDGAPAQDNA